MKELLESAADPNERENITGKTCLHQVCIGDDSRKFDLILALLLKYPNIRIDVYDDQLCTPLCYAIKYGRKETAKSLIRMGASIDEKYPDSNQTLKEAMVNKFSEIPS